MRSHQKGKDWTPAVVLPSTKLCCSSSDHFRQDLRIQNSALKVPGLQQSQHGRWSLELPALVRTSLFTNRVTKHKETCHQFPLNKPNLWGLPIRSRRGVTIIRTFGNTCRVTRARKRAKSLPRPLVVISLFRNGCQRKKLNTVDKVRIVSKPSAELNKRCPQDTNNGVGIL
jgi:hypothetical protein